MNMKKIVGCLLLVVLLQGKGFAEPIPVRGIVEGFYGRPWTQEQRIDMIEFCGTHGLNSYIYAPKDDPYHREKWREPYPKAQMKKIEALVRVSRANNIKFIFAISPGLDFSYSLLHGAADRKKLLEKMESVYSIGVRDFAVFFDDIEEKNGTGQAELLRWLEEHFVAAHGDVSHLMTVPTEYFLSDMQKAGEINAYTRDFAKVLPKEVILLFTGDGVAIGELSAETVNSAARIYGRKPGLWWNYPVNDYMPEKLALGPVEVLPKDSGIPAIFFNPMPAPELSKIAIAAGAEYAIDPDGYNPETAWKKAIMEQYGALSPQMELFAAQSQHMENSWARIGRNDDDMLRADMNDFWNAWSKGTDADICLAGLREKFVAIKEAADILRKRLPDTQRRECKGQLKHLARLAAADSLALDMLDARRKGDEKNAKKMERKLRGKLKEIMDKEDKTKLSESVCRAFIEEALRYTEKDSS